MRFSKIASTFLIIFGFWLVLPASVEAATYHVANQNPEDCSDSWVGSQSLPWCTITKAANTLRAGDSVLIHEGVYPEQVIPLNSGSADNYITYAAYPNETVILDGTSVPLRTWRGLFQIIGKKYLKVSGLRIENSQDFAILINEGAIKSDHITIENNHTKNSDASGIAVANSTNILVDGNTVVNARYNLANFGHEECISIINTDTFEVKNNTVYFENVVTIDPNDPEKNIVDTTSQFGAVGIDIKENSSNGKIYKNHVYDNWRNEGFYIDAWSGLSQNHLVYQNVVHDCAYGMQIAGELGGTVQNVKIFNNLFYNNQNSGIYLAEPGIKKDIFIFNNTLAKVKKTDENQYAYGIMVADKNVTNIQIKNNLVNFQNLPGVDSGQIVALKSVLAEVFSEGNLTSGPRYPYPYPEGGNYSYQEVSSGRIDVPETTNLFKDKANNDFHLLPPPEANPAINNGVDLSLSGVTDDLEGNPRPPSAFDIGAYEYSSGSLPTPAATSAPTTSFSPGDINQDGKVNSTDMVLVLAAWETGGSSGYNFREDINVDGRVNSLDAASVLLNWTL